MPLRPSHLPHNLERSALQKLNAEWALASSKVHPAGKKTIAGKLAKGCIKEQMVGDQGASYVISPEGDAALKAKIPVPACFDP